MNDAKPACRNLVLDAGPLLSLSPLRGLAETYFTVPQVLDELKDKRAREHFERLGLSAGVRVDVRSPDATSLAHVIQFAKKTGDYSVLAHADICVLALTYSLDQSEKSEASKPTSKPFAKVASERFDAAKNHAAQDGAGLSPKLQSYPAAVIAEELRNGESSSEPEEFPRGIHDGDAADQREPEPLDVVLERIPIDDIPPPHASGPTESSSAPLYDDPSDSDDGEGEWITPSNVALHKSHALDLLPSASGAHDGKGKGKAQDTIGTGCMSADFAMQNVLLQMGLNLISVDGKRIDKVKTWVLRCHACFKICKDPSKKFCPTCGNATLLRTSVTTSSPDASASASPMQVHLKKNFQYRTRGTVYSIPSPKPGSSKKGLGEGLILREDQAGFMRAQKREDGRREREDKKIVSGALAKGGEGGVKFGSWMDPDWVPEMISVGLGGKGRSPNGGGLPDIGYGRKNPNERKRRKE